MNQFFNFVSHFLKLYNQMFPLLDETVLLLSSQNAKPAIHHAIAQVSLCLDHFLFPRLMEWRQGPSTWVSKDGMKTEAFSLLQFGMRRILQLKNG